MKGRIFLTVAVLALVFGFVGAAPVRADECGDIPKLQQEAQAGKPQAQMELADCFFMGKGVPKDWLQATELCRKAAEQGYAPAQYKLGSIYKYGNPEVPKDENEAERWYSKAAQGLPALAKQGDAFAQYTLGMMYTLGEGGLPKDVKVAVQYHRKAAEQGHAAAQNRLGQMTKNGIGVPKDESKGVAWIRKAADQDHAWSQFQLGEMYEQGDGVPQDFGEAEKWYRKAEGVIPGARNKALELERKRPCLSKCRADANTCKAGCMGEDKADRATCNDLCAEAQKACNDSCE